MGSGHTETAWQTQAFRLTVLGPIPIFRASVGAGGRRPPKRSPVDEVARRLCKRARIQVG